MDRKKFHWRVQVTPVEGGPVVTRDYMVYWDPAREDMATLVGESCAAEESVKAGKKFMPVGAELVTA